MYLYTYSLFQYYFSNEVKLQLYWGKYENYFCSQWNVGFEMCKKALQGTQKTVYP